MVTYPVRIRRWTRKEYDRLAELGVLREDEPRTRLIPRPLRSPPRLCASHSDQAHTLEVFEAGATISPLSRPNVTVAVADLLP